MCSNLWIYIAPNDTILVKCTEIVGGWGSAPDPAGGAYSAPPDPLAGLGEGREGEGEGGGRGRGRGGRESVPPQP